MHSKKCKSLFSSSRTGGSIMGVRHQLGLGRARLMAVMARCNKHRRRHQGHEEGGPRC